MLRIRNTYCFFTATMFTQMCIHIMFIHKMPILFKTVTVYYAMGVEILGARLCRQMDFL
jgi:hypothetical protein